MVVRKFQQVSVAGLHGSDRDISKQDLQSCLSVGVEAVLFIGDSENQQLCQAVNVYKAETSGFDKARKFSLENFFWKLSFQSKQLGFLDVFLVSAITTEK